MAQFRALRYGARPSFHSGKVWSIAMICFCSPSVLEPRNRLSKEWQVLLYGLDFR